MSYQPIPPLDARETETRMFVLSLLVIPFLTLVPLVFGGGVPLPARCFAGVSAIAILINFAFWVRR